MQNAASFTIYNASAGSGKTFTLVKEYLKILFQSNSVHRYKNILAITFTNKAVGEMKERIIDMLKAFSDIDILKNPNDMFVVICQDLNLEPEILHDKSKKILETIIHNYAAFDISTIDGFTHRLIRTFAYDLNLPLNFEVELDQDTLLYEAVDRLISKAGTDKELTKTMVDFAIEKADDDKSYDVSYDFNKIAKLLTNEDHIPYIKTLKNKTIEDFKLLKNNLRNQIQTNENDIVELSTSVLNLIESNGLEFSNFSYKTLPNHFKKASELNLRGLYDNLLESKICERKGIYSKTLDVEKKNSIEAMLPQIETAYLKNKQAVFHLKFLKAFYRNLTPLSVLNAINNELNTLKEEQNKMLISEFNTLISNEIKNQPTPFIYERMGEKFNHYFIDEFQDTSGLQWDNLVPLLDNSLSSESGSTLIVGDAKQAIYRWRGGKAEQFIDLYNKKSIPFQIKQDVKNLPVNYRSFKEIITFNNNFFRFLATQVFSKETHKNLYENAYQNTSKKEEGFVNLSFINTEKKENTDELYPKKVFEIITNCTEKGYDLKDICVLVRKKKAGIVIADYLSQQKIRIMSSETLLLQNAPEVVFVNNILALLTQPKNDEIKIATLNYLTSKLNIKNKHPFFTEYIHLPLNEFFKNLEAFGIYIDSSKLLQLPLYELAETIIRQFNLTETSNAYIQFYLDLILDFTTKKGSDITGFLDYFEKKKESLSIVSPKGQNAVQIMTIHKSKGLEFPVVIFPYADLEIYKELEPKEWFPIKKENFNGFSHTLLNYNKDFENFGEIGQTIYNNHQAALELDNINLLYVALTRPVEQLYIISQKEKLTKEGLSNKKYSGLFINYLNHLNLWNDVQLSYDFGYNSPKISKNTNEEISATEQETFISSAKENHNIKVITNSGYLWDSAQEEAIEKGNLIHDVMAKIKTKSDVDSVLLEFVNSSKIDKQQANSLLLLINKIIEHPKLGYYYNTNTTNVIHNEQDIITKNGVILRPDRIIINASKEVVIIDYKTGAENNKYKNQLITYQDALEEMGYLVKKKVLVYINNDVLVMEI
ncbi:DNA helicase UvrD [Pseudalgibacter alginicilyticus]|uniref:DNA 3'-5' helicase n=1 Tax=Pseudalgibacter alginicilyticus TaxID=1736674 RepID=A0A0P0CYK0_9FLAO|nr:UvrD-helicase domain-containing protein [Pseudalgibacter alginicilyticus]ALJ05688.1 DNA helicase UvrD [Pseudalgibacter alginicilyticus]